MNAHAMKALKEGLDRVEASRVAYEDALRDSSDQRVRDRARNEHHVALAGLCGTVTAVVEQADKEWWGDLANVAALIEHLEATDGLSSDPVEHIIEIMGSPWKWTNEYNAMRIAESAMVPS